MHTCTHAHMHTCTHAHMHTCTNAQMHTCTNAQMYIYRVAGVVRDAMVDCSGDQLS